MKIYIKQGDQKTGPFSPAELQEKIYGGELSRSVMACAEGGEVWEPLDVIMGREDAVRPAIVPVPAMPLENLRDPLEKKILLWLYIASVPAWLFIILFIIGSYGVVLIFAGLIWMFHAIAELWYAAHLKTNAVRVSETQLPELNRAVETCCERLGMQRPEVYVLQSNVWNAFAAKLLGRRVVVLFSGAVDSILLKGDLQQLTWVVGHELGHHWAGHLNLSQKFANLGDWVFWLKLWHSRRAEFTCDRVGLYCTGSLQACQLALVNSAVGAQLANKVNMTAATEQWHAHRDEFFVKYRSLYSTHPHSLARLDHLNRSAEEFGIHR
jgi:Zn-dependent protease with chaperone function